MLHDSALELILVELEKEGVKHDRLATEKRFQFLNLEKSTAELLYLLVLGFQRKHILEIGTSNGYSTIWLAKALAKIEGSSPLITIEREREKAEAAKENFLRAKIAEKIKIVHGDATQIVATLEGPFDCLFFDADRISAPEQLKLLLPKLKQNVLLLTDNALSHPEEIKKYIEMVDVLSGWITMTIPVGKGLHIAYRC